jgi:Tol biopolymer transport system component
MRLAVLISLCLCPLAFGCRSQEHVFDPTGESVILSATEHYDEALRRAIDWKADAYLASISADVGSPNISRRGRSISFLFHAPSAANSTYRLRLNKDTWTPQVIGAGSSTSTAPPIEREQWTLDSVDAWSIAQANGGEKYLRLYQGPRTVVEVTLDYRTTRGGEKTLAWRVHYYISYGPILDMLIDPQTGGIIQVREHSTSGTLVATTPTVPLTLWAPLPVCTPATPEPGHASGLPERIAFVSSIHGLHSVYLMDPDGSNIAELPGAHIGESSASWSPDGQHMAFASRERGNLDVYVMSADGYDLVRLTDDPANDGKPTWSPDGSHIAFSSDRDGNYDIYIMNADGSNLARLTDHPLADDSPDWSPDGCRIAFVSERDHSPEAHVYVVNVDGSNLTQLTDGSTFDFNPRWSPDGTRIAFWSQPIGEAQAQPNVYVMEEDGSNKVCLTFDSRGGYRPVWSPDGTHIAFSIFRYDPYGSDIFLMDADGSNVVQLTHEAANTWPCSWRR